MTNMLVVGGALAVVIVLELFAVTRGPMLLLALTSLPVAAVLIHLTWSLRAIGASAPSEPDEMENGPAELLERWQARAHMLAGRADGSRADWDRHLRPLLAKEFELSAGARMSKNRRALDRAGVLMFGPELWRWVDPANSDPRDDTSRAPGRAALDEILRRLQQM